MNFLPNAELFFLSRKKLVRKSTNALFEGKDILLVGINAAFSPVDTQMVKDYEAEYDTFIKETEVDEIYFVAMNDPYVMDLTSELRDLDNKLFEYKGSETNANLYFTAGTKDKRPSFDPHHHEYHVIVKPIYGTCLWKINDSVEEITPEGVLILPAGTEHSVCSNEEPRLSLTINMSG